MTALDRYRADLPPRTMRNVIDAAHPAIDGRKPQHFQLGMGLYDSRGRKLGHVKEIELDHNGFMGLERVRLLTDDGNDLWFTSDHIRHGHVYTRQGLRRTSIARRGVDEQTPLLTVTQSIAVGARIFSKEGVFSGHIEHFQGILGKTSLAQFVSTNALSLGNLTHGKRKSYG